MNPFTNLKIWQEFYDDFLNETRELYQNKGFTYEIPKEEQIRSALYSFFKKTYPLIEIESDLIHAGKNSVVAEFDLRIITDKFDFVVEVKRAWSLSDWNNKYTESLLSWQQDIEKLKELDNPEFKSEFINSNNKKGFVLAVFYDSEKGYNKLKLSELTDYVARTWNQFQLITLGRDKVSDNVFLSFLVWVEK